MPHKLRKARKKRGTRTVGWGRVGQHRKTGQKGRRKAGRRKHLWSYVLRYEPDYFLKKGFHSARQKNANVINVGQLEELARRLSSEEGLEERNGLVHLDLCRLGYSKLLGFGKTSKPFSVEAPSHSESAARKVEEAGGRLIAKKAQTIREAQKTRRRVVEGES